MARPLYKTGADLRTSLWAKKKFIDWEVVVSRLSFISMDSPFSILSIWLPLKTSSITRGIQVEASFRLSLSVILVRTMEYRLGAIMMAKSWLGMYCFTIQPMKCSRSRFGSQLLARKHWLMARKRWTPWFWMVWQSLDSCGPLTDGDQAINVLIRALNSSHGSG